jgi:hypothetical protein
MDGFTVEFAPLVANGRLQAAELPFKASGAKMKPGLSIINKPTAFSNSAQLHSQLLWFAHQHEGKESPSTSFPVLP